MRRLQRAAGKLKRKPTSRPRGPVTLNAPLSLGHRAAPPTPPVDAFGPARYSPDLQRQFPDRPYTRVIKDALKIGKYKVGEHSDGTARFWEVDRKTISELAANFQLAQSRGVAFNLGASHGNPATRIIPNDELIAPIDEVVERDGVLWASFYVTPQQAKTLCNPAIKISPGIDWGWTDGLGHSYPIQMIHLAATDQPVIPGQGPFLAMANTNGTANGTTKGAAMDLAKLVELINQLLPEGVNMPTEGVTDENLIANLELIIATVQGMTGEAPAEETPNEGDGDEVAEVVPAEDEPVVMNNGKGGKASVGSLLLQLTKQVATLSNEVTSLRGTEAARRKEAYLGHLSKLGQSGTPAAFIENYKANGEALGWDIARLPALGNGVSMNLGSRKLASPAAPKLKTDEEKIAAAVALIRGKAAPAKK